MVGRQEAGGPVDRTARRKSARVWQDNKRREVFILGPKTVTQPRPHAGKSIERKATVHLKCSWSVVVALGYHRMNETDIIDAFRQVRQQVAYPSPRIAMLLEGVDALHQSTGLAKETKILAHSLKRTTVPLF